MRKKLISTLQFEFYSDSGQTNRVNSYQPSVWRSCKLLRIPLSCGNASNLPGSSVWVGAPHQLLSTKLSKQLQKSETTKKYYRKCCRLFESGWNLDNKCFFAKVIHASVPVISLSEKTKTDITGTLYKYTKAVKSLDRSETPVHDFYRTSGPVSVYNGVEPLAYE